MCRRVRDKLKQQKVTSGSSIAIHIGYLKFKVLHRNNTFIVQLVLKTCSCRLQELTSISCLHVIACIHWMGIEPNEYVDDYLKKLSYLRAYEPLMQHLNGKSVWTKVQSQPILPPIDRRKAGKYKKKKKERQV